MNTTFRYQKSPKTDFWTDAQETKPADKEALYLVVQKAEESQMLGFAWYRQDGNGSFTFTKEGVTHWAPAPKFPGEE